jgi:hypothetical protein
MLQLIPPKQSRVLLEKAWNILVTCHAGSEQAAYKPVKCIDVSVVNFSVLIFFLIHSGLYVSKLTI